MVRCCCWLDCGAVMEMLMAYVGMQVDGADDGDDGTGDEDLKCKAKERDRGGGDGGG